MQNYQIILGSVTLSSLLSAGIVVIMREWISTRIRASIEHEYKIKEISLKAELDGKLEGARAAYEKVLDENRIRFSRLYADQATATVTLYQRLYRMRARLNELTNKLQYVPDDPGKLQAFYDNQQRQAMEAFNACSAFFHENRILLPEDVCSEMDQLLTIAKKAYIDFQHRGTVPKKWDEAYDAMQGPFASLKDKLEKRFRNILGMLPETAQYGETSEPTGETPGSG